MVDAAVKCHFPDDCAPTMPWGPHSVVGSLLSVLQPYCQLDGGSYWPHDTMEPSSSLPFSHPCKHLPHPGVLFMLERGKRNKVAPRPPCLRAQPNKMDYFPETGKSPTLQARLCPQTQRCTLLCLELNTEYLQEFSVGVAYPARAKP